MVTIDWGVYIVCINERVIDVLVSLQKSDSAVLDYRVNLSRETYRAWARSTDLISSIFSFLLLLTDKCVPSFQLTFSAVEILCPNLAGSLTLKTMPTVLLFLFPLHCRIWGPIWRRDRLKAQGLRSKHWANLGVRDCAQLWAKEALTLILRWVFDKKIHRAQASQAFEPIRYHQLQAVGSFF